LALTSSRAWRRFASILSSGLEHVQQKNKLAQNGCQRNF
jgi:hypothetical protein